MQHGYLIGSRLHGTPFGKWIGMAHCLYLYYIYAPENYGEHEWKRIMVEN